MPSKYFLSVSFKLSLNCQVASYLKFLIKSEGVPFVSAEELLVLLNLNTALMFIAKILLK